MLQLNHKNNMEYDNDGDDDGDEDDKIKLKQILETPPCDHKIEIMKKRGLKRAHIYCKNRNLSGQLLGVLIEHYIKTTYGMVKNKSSLCNGDLHHNETNFEIKASSGGGKHNKFNFTQLRMNHDCEYILTAYYLSHENAKTRGELFIFKLTKINMKTLIFEYGGYAHGTILKLGEMTKEDLDNPTNDKEYAIRPTYGDKCWNELLHFRVKEI